LASAGGRSVKHHNSVAEELHHSNKQTQNQLSLKTSTQVSANTGFGGGAHG